MVPEVPSGTALRAAGGFGGFADFYPRRETPARQAARIETGTSLVALAMGAAPYDANSNDFIRVEVRVRSGPQRGRTGWISVDYTGLPVASVPASAETAAKACRCLIVRFEPG
ncbi:MAG: hypothetical protein IAI49_04065 [Candidatus Eremiobacteraeota bacterium]|nr:hypothetical protein [Candidatus Eremiobacteraeota bacterium]